ncbi:protease pro-enzyme activation domain-containing protein [Fodinicola feengrottensis]|uniref:protease pro-enzyme activation domain-containing protein n=1 Tax=Fodinicola feengrottensis TaxID=435914 RepID=UPI0013D8CBE0|nr:protease pro-enzyme activation domain-containing protein [Fodinicola feengrottensis]
MRQQHLIATAAVGAAVALCVPFGATAASAAPSGRAAISDSQPDWVQHSAPTGTVDQNQQLSVKLYLAGQNQAGLAAAARAVSDPASPQYRHYLSPEQYRAQYAPSDNSLAAVRQFLAANNLHAGAVPDNRLYISATGSVADVQKAFGTSVRQYQKDGQTIRAAATQTTVPASLSGVVTAVSGIASVGNTMKNDHTVEGGTTTQPQRAATRSAKASPDAPPPPAFVPAPPCSDYFAQKPGTGLPTAYGQVPPYVTCGYTPAQLQGAYGLTRSVQHGFDGRGVTVAIVDAYAAPTILADANKYATDHGQPAFHGNQFKQTLPPSFSYGYDDKVNGDQCGEQGWYGEEKPSTWRPCTRSRRAPTSTSWPARAATTVTSWTR